MTKEQFEDKVREIAHGQLAGLAKYERVAILEECLIHTEFMPDRNSPIEVIGEQDDLPF